MKPTILLTGVTGFLGSHIAENLVGNGIQVIGLKRKNANIWRCEGFKDRIIWVDIDEDGFFREELEKHSFDSIIHGAWIGVGSDSRDNWNEQSKNIPFLLSLLDAAKTVGVKKFVFLGSQAEYGNIGGKISENHNTNALNAYGSIKLACLEIVKTFCGMNDINWIWLRLFSLFGEKENQNWLIPSLINSMLTSKQMDFTPGEQKYAYLHVNDFSLIMRKIMTMQVQSGVYNISSDETRTIKSMIEDIRNYVNPEFILNFGALKYRDSQSMHMEGDILKLSAQIGEIEFTDFSIAIQNTVNHYLKNK
ncbi:NAD(P)-dependent oxidoreductase [uncultured Flavobacterium sp.]|uniref:NAD-dependent epimerase/dehydratase family protein n=1 Tax=uncultured Flavobacterium sp. TaxID=165435 RepID=UPI0030ECEC99|tara:strand:+ start:14370 stop:15287 length:918 start_codon:yes stop_codon:yes gene_type:complete